MSPQELLAHYDTARLWASATGAEPGFDVAAAYQSALGVRQLRQCPDAPDLQAGDVVTTGTWTDAWPVQLGQTWTAQFDAPLSRLDVTFG